MHMKKFTVFLIAVVTLVTGCVSSVYPFYTDKDVVTDVRLVGTWRPDKGKDNDAKKETWEFESTTNKTYVVTIIDDDDKRGQFECHLFKIRRELFIDLTPTEVDYATNQISEIAQLMIPGHLLFRVKFEDQKLKMAVIDVNWMEEFIKKHPSAIKHRLVNGFIYLTSETSVLQKFFMKHLSEGELFANWGEYKRL
jgi:hypothetical protein